MTRHPTPQRRSGHSLLDSLTLLTSFSTLICCALPALFVALGAGASLIGLFSAVPQLIWLSEHKALVFAIAGLMLVLSGMSRYVTRHAPCPIDPVQAQSCQRLRRYGFMLYLVSLGVYAIGAFFAFIAPALME